MTENELAYGRGYLEEMGNRARTYSERGYHSFAEQTWRWMEIFEKLLNEAEENANVQ